VLGEGHEIIASERAVTAQTPGGTGGLRVAGDLIKVHFPKASIWLSDPTWANHPKIFEAAGVKTKTYPYYDAENRCLAFDQMVSALRKVPAGDVVLFHGCCHNPTGMDPDPEQWATLAEVARERKFLPLLDFAYQGFADGIEEDARGVRTFCTEGCELLIASSFSKNFGLYCDRVGALTAVGATREAAEKAFGHIKLAIRRNYSNPPAHGGAIVTTILGDASLRSRWEGEVKEMRDRINSMRELFVKTLKEKGVERDFSFLTQQRGMFSLSGLTKDQVQTLKEKYSIYIVGSGRVNVAGMTAQNMDYVCDAIKDVL
jgi:aspartate/tyrosine/aromatic aminotransferase